MSSQKIQRILKSLVGEKNVSAGLSHRQNHGQDCSYHSGQPPDLVVWPRSTTEVMEIAKVCSKHKFPMIPYGTGTGLEGTVFENYSKIFILASEASCVNFLKKTLGKCFFAP